MSYTKPNDSLPPGNVPCWIYLQYFTRGDGGWLHRSNGPIRTAVSAIPSLAQGWRNEAPSATWSRVWVWIDGTSRWLLYADHYA